jgi:hypothetical protein
MQPTFEAEPRTKKQVMKSYVGRLLWIFGLFVFTQIAFMIISPHRNTNYQTIHMQLFLDNAVYFFLGIYLSILMVQSWYLTPKVPVLLFICLPCVVVSIFHPILGVTSPLWVTKLNTMGISSISAGASLMFGLFGGKRHGSTYEVNLGIN